MTVHQCLEGQRMSWRSNQTNISRNYFVCLCHQERISRLTMTSRRTPELVPTKTESACAKSRIIIYSYSILIILPHFYNYYSCRPLSKQKRGHSETLCLYLFNDHYSLQYQSGRALQIIHCILTCCQSRGIPTYPHSRNKGISSTDKAILAHLSRCKPILQLST